MASEPLPTHPRVAAEPRPAPARLATITRRRLFVDRVARWVVTAGGLSIIASILGILLFILAEVQPLLRPARVKVTGEIAVPGVPGALVVDEHRTLAAVLAVDGRLSVIALADGSRIAERDLRSDPGAAPPAVGAPAPAALPAVSGVAAPPDGRLLVAAREDGRLVLQPVAWTVDFDAQGRRVVRPDLGSPLALELDPEHRALGAFDARSADASLAAGAAQLADGRVVVIRHETARNEFSGEEEVRESRIELDGAPRLSALALDGEARNLYGGTADGDLLWWNLADGDRPEAQTTSAGTAAITALSFLIGDRSLVVGQESGAISVWFPVRQGDESFRLARVRDFPAQHAAIRRLAPSSRNRSFFALDRDGGLDLYHSTSERTLWRGRAPDAHAEAVTITPKGDGADVASPGRLTRYDLVNPHPEVSWRALFGRVWYEGYPAPEFTWQSTGGTDDFEPKLSLTPLVVGTLKGTFYSLLLAIPLGVLGAMFASQFLHPRLLNYIKPTVEIMAALPSVVLGFLAGLWLAPVLERSFPALILALFGVPLAVWLAGIAWARLPLATRNRFPAGSEIFLYVLVVIAALGACAAASPAFERLAFHGSFPQWLVDTTGLRYDQRNAVVVGLAMGFAVIPIIFAIAEDAFSNVPKNLVAGSLALGANRWQTVTRVVLPTASPGIFSAVMIGFGRAVGETMIVLMATGNTPILQLNPFNGFRTLSANIAVEIPEAPFGGTLYRTLFLAALLLFLLTFLVNTAAELVRQRLRRRFAEL